MSTYQYKMVKFYILTFLVTFLLWFVGAYFSYQDGKEGLYMLFMLPGLMTPFLISLFFIFKSNSQDLKKTFVERLFSVKLINLKLLPVFFLLMPLSVLISIAISLLFGGSASQFQLAEGFSFSTGFVPVLLLLLMAATFEELGWRGYAFDSLQSKYNVLKASIVFGILWSLWHFPLLLVNNSYQYEILNQNIWYAVNFFVGIVPLGIIISWICIKNNKSILAAITFHFIVNISQEILSMSQDTKCIQTFVLIVLAVIIIQYDKKLFFSNKDPLVTATE